MQMRFFEVIAIYQIKAIHLRFTGFISQFVLGADGNSKGSDYSQRYMMQIMARKSYCEIRF
jgi:hypothetical protein